MAYSENDSLRYFYTGVELLFLYIYQYRPRSPSSNESLIYEHVICSLLLRYSCHFHNRLKASKYSKVSSITRYSGGHEIFVRCLFRPFVRREFTSKEIALFSHQCCLQPVFIPRISTKASRLASIDTLTEDFVNGLQSNFPATITTVLKWVDFLFTLLLFWFFVCACFCFY